MKKTHFLYPFIFLLGLAAIGISVVGISAQTDPVSLFQKIEPVEIKTDLGSIKTGTSSDGSLNTDSSSGSSADIQSGSLMDIKTGPSIQPSVIDPVSDSGKSGTDANSGSSASGIIQSGETVIDSAKVNTITGSGSASSDTGTAIQSSGPVLTSGINKIPSFSFIGITDGISIKGTFDIKGKVVGARSVEYYVLYMDSDTPRYLGSASRSDYYWKYSFDSETFPNGTFYLKASIKNDYGTYESGKKKIVINNPVKVSVVHKDDTVSGSDRENLSGAISQSWQNTYFGSSDCQKTGVCAGSADPDQDGITNSDEFRFNTDPTGPDSDSDGFLDGDEVKNGFDPLKASTGNKNDKIIFESPKEKGEIRADIYKVEKAEIFQDTSGKNNMRFSGKAIPNSFVTLYIYSDPIILTIRTDKDGNWSYILDKELEDGKHEAYVAVTDNTGKITGKSEPLAFVKTAQAVEMITPAEASAFERAASPTKIWSQRDMFFLIPIVLAALAIVMASIGLYKRKSSGSDDDLI